MRKLTAATIGAMMALMAAAPPAFAHHLQPGTGAASEVMPAVLVALLVLTAAGYASGVARLWRKAGAGRGISRWKVVAFALGWTTLALALLSPIDSLADRSFALHMVQHELLMVVAAPLLALSPPARRALSTAAIWALQLAKPRIAWWVHAAAIWIWHVPAFFIAALRNEALHDLQHFCFFASALLFWQAVFGRDFRSREGLSLALLITTMLHTSGLGLLLTFAPTAWYMHADAALFGLTALEDQQLGGLVMWLVGSIPYVAAALAMVAAWLSPRRSPAR